MKIALVNNYYYVRGGCERVLFADQEALLASGHEVLPFAPQDVNNCAADSECFFPTTADYSAQRIAGKITAAIEMVYSRAAGRAFASFLDDFQPDLVHCHNIYGRLTTAILDEAKLRNIPVVMTVHDQKLVCPVYLGLREGKPCELCSDGGYWRCLRWKCHKQSRTGSLVYTIESYFNRLGRKYDSVSRFLCPSRFVQDLLVTSGVARERATYHPNALPLEGFAPNFEPGEYVFYAGRLSAEKGILTLLAAIERANIPLRIAGTGPIQAQILDLIKERHLPVQLEGYCTGERLSELYRHSAFTVVPSECNENAPMSVLESAAYGKPVLASRIGGNPELVIDRQTGRLFSPGKFEELAKLATEMWANRDELINMGKRARCSIEHRFSQERRLSDLLTIYRDLKASTN